MMQMLSSNEKISIVVPVYRSEIILPRLVHTILSAMQSAGEEGSFELILVNDASPDDVWGLIEKLAARHEFIKGICLVKNVGQHNAIMAGLSQAEGAIIVIMDDDLQHSPEAIMSMVEAIRSGFDVCYTRYAYRQHARWKKIGSWINDRAANILLKKPAGLYLSSFKALHRQIVDEIIKYDGPFAYIDGIILDITRNITVVAIQHYPRFDGDGNYTLWKSVSLWLKMATSFSILPLRLASVVGAAIAVMSVVFVAAIITRKLLHPEIAAGWTSLAALILFIGGVQLISLGVVGEYVGRMYLRLNRKPQYVVRSIVSRRASQDPSNFLRERNQAPDKENFL